MSVPLEEMMGLFGDDAGFEDEQPTMSDDDLVGIINREIDESSGESDEVAQNFDNAEKYFFGKPLGNEISGRSQVVDTAVADSIEATLAQCMPIFNNPEVAMFDAVSENDQLQATIESHGVTHVVMNMSDGYNVFLSAIKNSLIYKNGITKVEDTEVSYTENKQLQGLSEMQYAQILSRLPDVSILSEEQVPDQMGMPVINASLNYTEKKTQVFVKSVHPRDFLIAKGYDSMDLEQVHFCAEISHPRRFELIEDGFDEDIVNELTAVTSDTDDNSSLSSVVQSVDDQYYSSQKATDAVITHDCYIRVDYDLDGIAELRRVILGSKKYVLYNEPVKCIPFAVGSPFPVPDKFRGQSFFDKLKGIQESKTAVQRQYWDNLNANNNRRMGVNVKGIQTPDTLLESKPGWIIHCKTNPAEVLMPIPVDDIGPSCIQALDYLDRQRSEKVGAALDMQTQQMQVNNETAHGAERMISAKEEMSAFILANLCNSMVRKTYLLVHKRLRELEIDVEYSVAGQWTKANTGEWLARDRVSIDVGMSKGERSAKTATLQGVYEMQQAILAAGKEGILTDDSKVYNTLADIIRFSGLNHADRYWSSPLTQPSQQRIQQNGQMQEEVKQAERAMQQAQMQLQTSLAQAEMLKAQNGTMSNRIKELEAMVDAKDKSEELDFKYEEMYQDNATKLAIAEGDNIQKQQTAKESIGG